MRGVHRVAMAVDGYSRLSNIPELQELLTSNYNWVVDAHEPKHLLLFLAASFGLLAIGLVLWGRYS